MHLLKILKDGYKNDNIPLKHGVTIIIILFEN